MRTTPGIPRQTVRPLFAALLLAAAACTDDPTGASAPAGKPTRIRMTTAIDMGLPASTLDTVFAVVTDESERPVPSAAVVWTVQDGGGSVRALSSRTDAAGTARAIWTLGTTSGDNTLAASSSSVSATLTAVAADGFPATAIVIGGTHACGLVRSGAAYCWGSNAMGQLGIGTTDEAVQPSPVRVKGGQAFTALVAGVFHTCGLTSAGEAYCWGGSPAGQVGSPGPFATTPTRVAVAERFTALAAGAHHTCGLTTTGTVDCWGDDTFGELGLGRDRSAPEAFGSSGRAVPGPIVGGRTFVAIAASYEATCGITTTGQTFCWGGNSARELGSVTGTCRMLADGYDNKEDWDRPCSTTPVTIDTPTALKSLTGSTFAFCGTTADDALTCWGDALVPPTVIPDARVSRAWSLGHDVCGIGPDGGVSCWAVYDGRRSVALPFGQNVALANFSTVGNSSCGLTRAQPAVAYCWGSNDVGQLGDGTTVYRGEPVPVRVGRAAR